MTTGAKPTHGAATSSYLNRPLRTLEQAQRDREQSQPTKPGDTNNER